ncbi:hypothetical protein KGA66_20715 [Actinocrinis puniceicyclus]|uniref:Uncharacterized protein n=1 Tax=Actinocrinis puniceicyclus TaxID=977794 RepID=A0A8J8BG77_9ACTN|nr:hypothetical protein [Actinocrinis puniceicyclus]MBS2965484.1 hypothetical protein [Actinocrinis puniceicyclus]
MPEPAGVPGGAAAAPPGGALMVPPDRRLVVPVLSGCGGVGRTTVAALLAATLHRRTLAAPGDARAGAVLDCAARGNTPWPAWLTAPAPSGTGVLAGHRGAAGGAEPGVAQLTEAAASHLALDAPTPLWVYTDTGPASPFFLGAHPGPRWWLPVLSGLRVAVVDGDALEGARLAAQAVGGPLSATASWFATPFLNTAAVWVTDSGEASLRRTIDALTCIAEVRIPVDRVVVAVVDRRGTRRRGGSSLTESWYELIAPRAGALVDLGHDRALADQGGCPPLDAAALDRPPLVELARAVAAAARLPWIPEGEPALFDPVAGAPGPAADLAELLLRQAGRAAFG